MGRFPVRTRRRGWRRALLAAAAGSVAAVLFACAPYSSAGGRLPLRGERAIVHIEGRGEVTSPGLIACGPGSAAGCEGAWTELGASSLVATPEAGWRFERWEWRQVDAPIAPSFAAGGETYAYTAVFVPDRAAAPKPSAPRRSSAPRQVSRCGGTAASTEPC